MHVLLERLFTAPWANSSLQLTLLDACFELMFSPQLSAVAMLYAADV